MRSAKKKADPVPEENQTSGLVTVENGRDKNGKFRKGRPGGPGRPPGAANFLTICRREAEAAGIDLETWVWEVARALFDKAVQGDVPAAKLILDRICGLMTKEPALSLQVSQAVSPAPPTGPPVPEGRAFVDYFRTLAQLADDLEIEYLLSEDSPSSGSRASNSAEDNPTADPA